MSGPGPSWETIVLVWGWVTIRGVGGHAFMAPRGTAVDTDGRVALQLTAEPLTTHVVVVALQWGSERPQPSRDPIAGVLWRNLPTLQATILLARRKAAPGCASLAPGLCGRLPATSREAHCLGGAVSGLRWARATASLLGGHRPRG